MLTPIRCRKCFVWYHPQQVKPEVCPNCEQSADWEEQLAAQWPFTLSENDRKFLKSIRIAVNNDHEADGA